MTRAPLHYIIVVINQAYSTWYTILASASYYCIYKDVKCNVAVNVNGVGSVRMIQIVGKWGIYRSASSSFNIFSVWLHAAFEVRGLTESQERA